MLINFVDVTSDADRDNKPPPEKKPLNNYVCDACINLWNSFWARRVEHMYDAGYACVILSIVSNLAQSMLGLFCVIVIEFWFSFMMKQVLISHIQMIHINNSLNDKMLL